MQPIKLRRAMMFMPGNNPAMLQNADIYGADTVIFDLEDAVSINEKDAARHLVFSALKHLSFSCEIAVRINHIQTPYGLNDLALILQAAPDLIRLPKAETADDIRAVDEIIAQAEQRYGFTAGSIKMMAAIESAKGLMNAYEIACASPRMVALAIGGEDFVADLKTTRSKEGIELLQARSQLLLAARAAGINAIDSVFSDANDENGLIAETKLIKQLGFDGKSVINPRQVHIVQQIFMPTEAEVVKAERIIAAYNEAVERKAGVVALDGKMIDTPIVTRAERVMAYAAAARR